jgi:hypothetical protein
MKYIAVIVFLILCSATILPLLVLCFEAVEANRARRDSVLTKILKG